MSTKHSPLPEHVKLPLKINGYYLVVMPNGASLFSFSGWVTSNTQNAILECINNYSAVVAENKRLREACTNAFGEVCAVCVTPSNPRDDDAFPQLSNPADRECLAKAIDILRAALATAPRSGEEGAGR